MSTKKSGIEIFQELTNKFVQDYPSLTRAEIHKYFYLYIYATREAPKPSPVVFTLPTEKDGPFHALVKNCIPLLDAGFNQETTIVQASDEEDDFWSVDVDMVNGSIFRLAECVDEKTMDALEEELTRLLKLVKSLPENTEEEFIFTSFELLQAIFLWRLEKNY